MNQEGNAMMELNGTDGQRDHADTGASPESQGARTLRLAILDDHPVVLDGLANMIGSQPGQAIVARCTNPDEIFAVLQRERPDVLISDIKMPGANIFAVVKRARIEWPALKVLFLSGHDDDIFIERAFAAGAAGFVSKLASSEDIYAAIQTVAAGGRYISNDIKAKIKTDEGEAGGAGIQTRLSILTPREREILRHVSMGMSAREISQELKISTWTVTNHKANIMAKLGIHNQVGLTRFAVSTGLANL
jgi:DNA-binding NarL/FixJ family response regulator